MYTGYYWCLWIEYKNIFSILAVKYPVKVIMNNDWKCCCRFFVSFGIVISILFDQVYIPIFPKKKIVSKNALTEIGCDLPVHAGMTISFGPWGRSYRYFYAFTRKLCPSASNLLRNLWFRILKMNKNHFTARRIYFEHWTQTRLLHLCSYP